MKKDTGPVAWCLLWQGTKRIITLGPARAAHFPMYCLSPGQLASPYRSWMMALRMILEVACVGILNSLVFWPSTLSAFYLFHLPNFFLKNVFSFEYTTGVGTWMTCSQQSYFSIKLTVTNKLRSLIP